MLNIFKSKKQKLQDVSQKMLSDYLAELQSYPEPTIGELLDGALKIKLASVNVNAALGEGDEANLMFSDPKSVDENRVFQQLEIMQQKMAEFSINGQMEKVAMLAIWYLSISSLVFEDQIDAGRLLWSILSRGFLFCDFFDPETDIPKGLEP